MKQVKFNDFTSNNSGFTCSNAGGATDVTLSHAIIYGPKVLLEVKIFDVEMHLIFRQEVMSTLGLFGNNHPRITREVWMMKDGRFQCVNTIEGKYVPAQEESYEF